MGSGSGRVVVVPIDRGDQGGSNGGSHNVWVAVLMEISTLEVEREKS
jgi:hypothetical protein